MPTLMVYGTLDAEIEAFAGTALYKFVPNVEVASLPSYHFIITDKPKDLAKLILDFLAKL